ncbi:MAG TPA: ferredoxin [Desulfonatronum sp.]|nr:ferredoxin [Desulfonatronum sp.]
MKTKRDIVHIDEDLCDGCGLCVPGCAEGAIEVREGKARLVAEKYCDGLGACLGECPKGAITMVQREAEVFDAAAVEDRMNKFIAAEKARALQNRALPNLGCGCPGTAMSTFAPASLRPVASANGEGGSALTHWPVQIRLVPPEAPFLKGAELLVAADCAPVAYPLLHQELLPGKIILMGCPKFDDVQDYSRRFTEIFQQAGISSVTVLSMEVPCCSGLADIVVQSMAKAGVRIPFKEVVVSRQGDIMPEARGLKTL